MGGGGGIGSDAARAPYQPAIPQQAQPDPYYWSGNFWGANDGSGIGQGAGMAPGMGGFNNPGVPTSPQQWYGNGGYNPYDPQTYGGSAMQNLGTGQPNVSTPGVFDTGTSPWAPAYLSGGGLNPNDPGNIAAYYRLMGGGGGIPIMAQGGDPQVDPLTSTLTSQRADYANRIRNDPNLSLQLASRMYSEDQNNPDTRVAIVEAMMNRLKATGQDPLNPSYYPGDQSQYNAAYNKLSGNNDLLNQVHQEMERAFGGSNLSNFATNWASGDLAKHDIQLSTPTWLSPTGEQFYRKDISNEWAGPGIADQNQRWFQSLSSPPR
jgi:hypothetical protein